MIHGFDLNSPLVCEGIIGDGCGGGRLFFVKNETLQAYDPTTKDTFVILENILDAVSITKSKCIITIKCVNDNIEFDLSSIQQVVHK